jgi:hypothetical protein
MKLLATLVFFAVLSVVAANEAAPAAPDAVAVGGGILNMESKPQVRVDVLMVSVPEESALKFIPLLRDAATIDAAQKAILELVAEKKGILLGWPEVTTVSGMQGVSEQILEKRYQTEPEPQPHGNIVDQSSAPASEFEVKNVGITLQVDPLVSKDGKSVMLNVAPQRVAFIKMDDEIPFKTKSGAVVPSRPPVFSTSKITAAMVLRDGERRLIYLGKSAEHPNSIDLFILGVKVIPASR